MRGVSISMLQTILLLMTVGTAVRSSGIEHSSVLSQEAAQVLPAPAPIVTAASSQYFERTFNRLVAVPPPLQPVVPVISQQPVFVEPVVRTLTQNPVTGVNNQNVPLRPASPASSADPNVAIAVATAHAAPVATILLPPYPFGFPPGFNFISPQTLKPSMTESTTRLTSSNDISTTTVEPEQTTPLPEPSNTDDTFAQALPSEQNTNFKQFTASLPESNIQPTLPKQQNFNFKQYSAPFQGNNDYAQVSPSQQNVNIKQYAASLPKNYIQPILPMHQNINYKQYSAPFQGNNDYAQHIPSEQNTNFKQYAASLPENNVQPTLPIQQNFNYNQYSASFYGSNHYAQNLPSQQNVNFKQYASPHVSQARPQKVKTSVEIVPVPLAYIAPPPLTHEHIVIKHVHTYVPEPTKIIIRETYVPLKIRTARVPSKTIYTNRSLPFLQRTVPTRIPQNAMRRTFNEREREPTTFSPFLRPNAKPPKL